MDLVEANEKGRQDMQELFAMKNIPGEKYEIFPCRIEDYETYKKYDIVIAEGFLPYIFNQQEVINKLQSLVAENGVIVITCSDDVCFFVELMKRLVAVVLSHNISDYNQKVEYLADFFGPQLDKLRGVSRSARDWVKDQILNPAGINGMELTMSQAVDYFGEEFDLLGSSPRMFTDYSWYKDIWSEYRKDASEQFRKKRLTLLRANMPEVQLSMEQADILVSHFEVIKKLVSEYEMSLEICKINEIVNEICFVQEHLPADFDDEFLKIFNEIKTVLQCIQQGSLPEIEQYPHFFSAFGRTLQYMSFVKKS